MFGHGINYASYDGTCDYATFINATEGRKPMVDDRTPEEKERHRERLRKWYLVWHALSKAKQDAWQTLTRQQKDMTYAMTGEQFKAAIYLKTIPEFLAFMANPVPVLEG